MPAAGALILNNSCPSCCRSRLASMPPCPTTSCNHVMLISYVNIHQANPSRTLEEKLRGRVLDLALGPKNGPRNAQWICIVCKAPSTISPSSGPSTVILSAGTLAAAMASGAMPSAVMRPMGLMHVVRSGWGGWDGCTRLGGVKRKPDQGKKSD